MRMAIAQLDPTVGDLDGNLERALAAAQEAAAQGAQLVVFPPSVLTGAPLEGLAYSVGFAADASWHLRDFTQNCPIPALLTCHRLDAQGQSAEVFEELIAVDNGHVGTLETDDDDEELPAVEIAGKTIAVLLNRHVTGSLDLAGADILVEMGSQRMNALSACRPARGATDVACSVARDNGCFIVDANLCGAADAVVFGGNSLAIGPDGALLHAAPVDAEDLYVFDTDSPVADADAAQTALLEGVELQWRGITCATRGYVRKNGFSDVVVGLSGGIDSSVVASIAVDALGAEHVHGVLMPGPYSSEGSVTDAAELASNLGIDTVSIPIDGPLASLHEALGAACGGSVEGIAAENLQARIRAVYLQTLSNAKGWLVLNTGNKSEAAMGFSTLGGDTAGVYAPIGQVYKTDVYELARWRMQRGPSIPQACADKAPSAELYPDARDDDRLPPYDELDKLLGAHVEEHLCEGMLVSDGHDRVLVDDVLEGVRRNEFKRRLEPMGPLVNGISLNDSRDWPVTCAWHDSTADKI